MDICSDGLYDTVVLYDVSCTFVLRFVDLAQRTTTYDHRLEKLGIPSVLPYTSSIITWRVVSIVPIGDEMYVHSQVLIVPCIVDF